MKFTTSKKAAVAVGAGAIAVAASGVGYAFFNGGTGTGTGDATTAASADVSRALDVTVSEPTLAPGADASTLTITVTNNNKYTLHFDSLGVALGSLPTACDHSSPAWIVLGGTTSYTNSGNGYTVQPGAANKVELTSTTLAMADDPSTDQGACLGQSIPVTATISNS